jgi:VanZ family protein
MLKKNLFSILIAAGILYLSLANAENFREPSFINIPYLDKIVHFGMYFSLSISIFFENRRSINSLEKLLLASLIPLAYGILMEILQMFTTTRSASFGDGIADFAGIVVALIVWRTFLSRKLKSL